MLITLNQHVIATNSRGRTVSLRPNAPIAVDSIKFSRGRLRIKMGGAYIVVSASLLAAVEDGSVEQAPEYIACQPYASIDDYTVYFYRDGHYYSADQMPEKFRLAEAET